MSNGTRISEDDLDFDGHVAVWQGLPFTGVSVAQGPDGVLVSETSYVAGLEEGVSRVWHPDGQLSDEEHYWRGGLHGPSRGWTQEGQLVRDAVYEFGILVREICLAEKGQSASIRHLDPDDPRLVALRRAYGNLAPPV